MANTMFIAKTNTFTVTDEERYNMLMSGICAEDCDVFSQKEATGDNDRPIRIKHSFGGYSVIGDYMPPYELVPEIMEKVNAGEKIYTENNTEVNLDDDWNKYDTFYDKSGNQIYEKDYDCTQKNFEGIFIPELQKILDDDSYVLLTTICYEKLRFVTADCLILTKTAYEFVVLEDAVKNRLNELGLPTDAFNLN